MVEKFPLFHPYLYGTTVRKEFEFNCYGSIFFGSVNCVFMVYSEAKAFLMRLSLLALFTASYDH